MARPSERRNPITAIHIVCPFPDPATGAAVRLCDGEPAPAETLPLSRAADAKCIRCAALAASVACPPDLPAATRRSYWRRYVTDRRGVSRAA